MDIVQAVILGIIEGITEFLPVSSTGHLIVASYWLSIEQTEANKAFEVIIQFAAILAVVLNYKDKFSLKHRELWVKVTLAFLPIGTVGFFFHTQIKAFFTVPIVGTMFIGGGIIFLIVESFYQEDSTLLENIDEMTYKQACWIGIIQVFSLVPGTSRAGASIVGGMLLGLSRKASTEFSFLLALPVLAAAAGFDMFNHYQDFSAENMKALAIGFITSFIVAYLTIKLFLLFLEKFTFVWFGIYRIIFGVFLLVLVL